MAWSNEIRKAVDELEEKYHIGIVSSEHSERIHSKLFDARAENKKLREALKNSADDIEASIGSSFMLAMLTGIVVSMRDFADKALKDK